MWKRKTGRKLSREKGQRTALLLSLMRELLLKEKIKTTEAKAKEVARFAEKMITVAKHGTLASTKSFYFLSSKERKDFFEKTLAAQKSRNGGYTRVIKLGQRQGNGARMAFVELVK